MKEFIKAHSKSIAATLATLIVSIGAKYGFKLDINVIGGLVGILLIGGATYISPPNEKKPVDDAPAAE